MTMFNGLWGLFAAWREAAHFAEWTGISLGLLAGCVALFVYDPAARRVAIAFAVAVTVGWFGLVHGEATGAADKQKQWDDARLAALKAQTERDTRVERDLDRRYQPKLKALEAEAAAHKAKADAYETELAELAKHPAPATKTVVVRAACELGAAADRLPKH